MEAIEVEELSKRFGTVQALDAVTFSVLRGELFGLIGPDGAGKTTLFRLLTTLLTPDGGWARVGGCDIVRDYRTIRSHVGYMPGRFSLYGDLTVDLLEIEDKPGRILCWPKAETVICGADLAARLFKKVGLEVEQCARDGQRLAPKTVFLKAFGSAGRIHAVYKTAQNIMEYCSGIATRTADMIAAAQAVNPKCRVVTTRKHFPGTKVLSLYAVQTAAATEHRTGLSESVLVFDQHRTFCGDDFLQTLAQMRERDPERKIAVEAASFDEALAFAKAGADIIQCEKFSVELFARTASALKEVRPQVLVSAAGGLRADNAADYARAGADFLVTTWPYFGRPYDIKMSIEGLGC